jgi:hypothetical protein
MALTDVGSWIDTDAKEECYYCDTDYMHYRSSLLQTGCTLAFPGSQQTCTRCTSLSSHNLLLSTALSLSPPHTLIAYDDVY